MILYCVTLYFGNVCFSSQRSGLYFAVFLSVFSSLFCIHGQHISSTATVSLSLSTTVASILLTFTIVLSGYKECPNKLSLSHVLVHFGFGWVFEYHGPTAEIRSSDLITSKKRIFRALLCRDRYFVCINAPQPARMCETLSVAFLHIQHFSSPVVPVPVFLL